MDTVPFKSLYDGDGPWTSVYLPTARNETDAAHKIELRWRELRERLAGDGAPEADLRAIDETVGSDRGLNHPHGQAIFASEGAVVFQRELSAAGTTAHACHADLPDALPLLAQTPDLGDYLVVFADRQNSTIELHARGPHGEEHDEHVRGRDKPLTKVSSGDWQQNHRQHRAENTWKANARDLAGRVEEIAAAHDVDLIAIAGDVRARTLLHDQLHRAWRSRAAIVPNAGFPPGADSSHTQIEAERMAAEFEQAWRSNVLDRYAAGLAAGTAVQGLEAVVEALRSGEVDTLLLRPHADEADAPLWWGPEPSQLSLHPRELEGTRAPRIKRARAADALVRTLVRTDGDLLLFANAEPGPQGLTGAILRRG
jgi:hypothetical protein